MATTNSRHWRNMYPVPNGNPTTHCPVLDLGNPAGTGTVLLGATGDFLRLVTVPERVTAGAGFAIIGGDHDTGAGLVVTLQLNDGTTPRPLIHQSTVLQAGGIARPTKIVTTETGVGFTTNSKLWWLEILINTQAAGAQAARLLIQLDFCGWYTPGAVTE